MTRTLDKSDDAKYNDTSINVIQWKCKKLKVAT